MTSYFWSGVMSKTVENAASDCFESNFSGTAFLIGGLLVIFVLLKFSMTVFIKICQLEENFRLVEWEYRNEVDPFRLLLKNQNM